MLYKVIIFSKLEVVFHTFVTPEQVSEHPTPSSSSDSESESELESVVLECDPESDPGLDPGSDPGLDPGSDPGLDPGSDPGLDPGLDPGSDPGLDPESDPGGPGFEFTGFFESSSDNGGPKSVPKSV